MSQSKAKEVCREGRVHLQRGRSAPLAEAAAPTTVRSAGRDPSDRCGSMRRGARGSTLVHPERDRVWRELETGEMELVTWRPPQVCARLA